MKRNNLFLTMLFMLLAFAAGCAQLEPMAPFTPEDLGPEYRTGKYLPKVDNYVVILDASSSMGLPYVGEPNTGHTKFDVAKDLVSRMNKTLPAMNISGAVQTFGHGSFMKGKLTDRVFGLDSHTREGLAGGLAAVPSSGGTSPAGLAVNAVGDLLASTPGKTAVIFVSDGEDLGHDPIMEAKALKNRYGHRVCLYPVWVGNKPSGKKFMDQFASVMNCGFATDAKDIAASADMARFVEKVFFAMVGDRDGDGVPDNRDRCPDTPAGVKVDANGCPLDTDGDGVYDYLDKCPGTPKGVRVDKNGCPPAKAARLDSDGDGVYDDQDSCPDTPRGAMVDYRGCWVVKGLNFDFAQADVKIRYNSNLDNIVSILKKNPKLKVRIEGHTDNVGSMAFNEKLSLKRAKAVKTYLVKRGIEEKRLYVIGYSFTRPVTTNDTPEGRALNRRAELKPIQ